MEGTFWAIVPALVTIIIALAFKQVYVALFVGVFTGAMMLAGGNPLIAFERLFKIMANTLSDSFDPSSSGGDYNFEHGAILIFILMLGILVVLMNKAGGTQAMGNWFAKKVRSRKGILGVTAGFGVLMFMDDYFNRLATGSVMRPITDKYRISRVKLAFIIGSLSVSVCILIPISSWASAIASTISEGLPDGSTANAFTLYLQSVACNFYPILTIIFIVVTSVLGMDFFTIRKREKTAIETGDVTCGKQPTFESEENYAVNPRGKIIDLVLPILAMIVFSIGFMFFFNARYGDMLASISLACGSTLAVIFTMILYIPRKVLTFAECNKSFGDGFKSICDVFMILILAWTLSDICSELDVGTFVSSIASAMGDAKVLLPAIMFLIAMGTSFATGTSWGTFGIIVPLVIPMFTTEIGSQLQILTVSAVLSGAVFGDQVSPISDATILSAATAQCDHMDYVKAQLPVALLNAVVAFVGFLAGGLTNNIWVGWLATLVGFVVLIAVSYFLQKKKGQLLPKLTLDSFEEEKDVASTDSHAE